MIKNPYNSYFNHVFLSANPFPSIITYTKNEGRFDSYSLSGILIKTIKLNDEKNILIIPLFNVYGGTFKDRIILTYDKHCQILNVPFFDINEKESIV